MKKSEQQPTLPDLDTAVGHLTAVRPRGPWTLTAIAPDGEGAPTETFLQKSEIPAMSDWIARHNHNAGIYFCANPTRKRMHKRPREEHILAFQYCGLDFDPGADETPDDCWTRVLAILDDYLLKPTLVWSTGNGVQALWWLKPAIMLKDRAQILRCKSAGRALVHALGSDSTQSMEHLFRVCGTVNYPNRVKRKAGRTVILASNLIHHPDRAYQLSDFPSPKNCVRGTARGLETPIGGWNTRAGIVDAVLHCKTTRDVAAEGRSGTAIRTACCIRDYGVSEEKCFDLMWENWVPRCDYDWNEDELRGKIKRAYEVAENDPGCRTRQYRLMQAREEFSHE